MLRKYTMFMEKNIPCISQGMKKASVINRFFESFKHYAFFRNYANYALRAEFYAISYRRIILEAL